MNSYRATSLMFVIALVILSGWSDVSAKDQVIAENMITFETVSEVAVTASVFSGGGSRGSSSSFRLASTVSQFAVGNGVYGASHANHGFWYVVNGVAVISCCGLYTEGFAGNVNCSADGRRDIIDITVLIDHVYISHRELCCPANGNLDTANGEEIDLADITRLIDHVYISKKETVACE